MLFLASRHVLRRELLATSCGFFLLIHGTSLRGLITHRLFFEALVLLAVHFRPQENVNHFFDALSCPLALTSIRHILELRL